MSGSSWVSLTFTSANSAATKKPFKSTSANTARTRSSIDMVLSQFMLKTHLAKNDLEQVLKRENSGFSLVSSKHDCQAFTAPLQPLQSIFQPQVFIQKKCWPQKLAHRFRQI